jgi:purine-binding chemotaxis protein CheW
MNTAHEREAEHQYLTVELDRQHYGLAVEHVAEIVSFQPVYRVPNGSPSLRGIINLRGEVVPVIDLAQRLGLRPSPVTPHSCLVIVELTLAGAPTKLALAVDAAVDVLTLAPHEIEPPPSFGTPVSARYLAGMARSGAEFAVLLDITRVLSLDELRAADDAARAAVRGAGP